MTITLKCERCDRRFYIQGKDEELVNAYSDAALRLRMIGYRAACMSAWRLVQARAKCCKDPDIATVTWDT